MRRPALTVRRTAVAVGVVLLAVGAWWVVRAPAIGRQAVAAPPDIDIDPPGMRARREAAFALAAMPDDPWTFAEALAASAPAPAKEKDSCGLEGRPVYAEAAASEAQPVQTAGASSGYIATQVRLEAALRASTDPLDRAVADLLNVGDLRSQSGAIEAVVQQAAVTTDARLYALGYRMCHANLPPAPGCGAISLERWIQLDPGNGTPWLMTLSEAQARGDAEGVRAAMSGLASATRFDMYPQIAAGAVARRAARNDADLAAVNDLSFKATTVEAVLGFPPFQPLILVCQDKAGGDAALAQTCRTISDTMFAHSDTLISLAISGALLLQTTGDASRRDFIRAERTVAAARWSPATGFSECHEMRDWLNNLTRTAKVGEVEAMRERMRQFVAP